MGELVLRDSFNIIQGRANSGSDRLRVWEVTQMDGPGFSLCAVPLESLGPVFQSSTVGTTVGGMEVWSILDKREMEKT